MFQRLIPAVILALAPVAASAEVISFNFAGHLDKAQAYGSVGAAPLAVGTGFTGNFSIELVDDWQSLPASDDLGAFISTISWSVSFDGGHSAEFVMPRQVFPYSVGNDAPVDNLDAPIWDVGTDPVDSVQFVAAVIPFGPPMSQVITSLPENGFASFGFGFFDATLLALSADLLTPGQIDWTAFGNIQLFIDMGEVGLLGDSAEHKWDGYQLRGVVTEFAPIPLPMTLPLFASALLGLMIAKRRR